jgi:transcriptional regulator with XRE-family HTH domain
MVRMVRKLKAHGPHKRRTDMPKWYAREWIAAKGLKQTDIVARTSFNKGLVSAYISGSRRWNEDVLFEFAHAIGVDWADLLKPPQQVENELANYVMGMDAKKRAQALKVLRALEGPSDENGDGEQVA